MKELARISLHEKAWLVTVNDEASRALGGSDWHGAAWLRSAAQELAETKAREFGAEGPFAWEAAGTAVDDEDIYVMSLRSTAPAWQTAPPVVALQAAVTLLANVPPSGKRWEIHREHYLVDPWACSTLTEYAHKVDVAAAECLADWPDVGPRILRGGLEVRGQALRDDFVALVELAVDRLVAATDRDAVLRAAASIGVDEVLRRAMFRLADLRADAFVQLRKDGWSLSEMAEEFGISRARCSQIIERFGDRSLEADH